MNKWFKESLKFEKREKGIGLWAVTKISSQSVRKVSQQVKVDRIGREGPRSGFDLFILNEG